MKSWVWILTALCFAFSVAGTTVAAEDEAAKDDAGMQKVSMEDDTEAVEMEEDDAAIELDFVINAIPAALLIDMNGNNFEPLPGERSASSVYMMPNLSVGVGLEAAEAVYVDGMVGAGVLVNESFRAFFVQAALSGTMSVTESLNIGPRIGLMQFFGAEWLEEGGADELDFDDNTGFFVGLQLAMGDRVRYLVQVDYVSAEFDANSNSDVELQDDKLSLDALAVQFGVRGEF